MAPRLVTVDPPAEALGPWPERRNLSVLSAPDWGDYHIYPEEARLAGQQGPVILEDLVGPDGRPRACRIVRSSGYEELDEGSCDLFMQMRFEPPRNEAGKPVWASFMRRIVWQLSEAPKPFAASSMAASLRFENGAALSCQLSGSGPFLSDWSRIACPVLTRTGDYYLGRYLASARKATIFVDLIPDGMSAPAHGGPGRWLIASRRTEFELAENGDPVNCRSPVSFGFGTPREDHATACGFFMTQPWFDQARPDGPPRTGAIEVKVFLDR